jgi:hypothetical protein
LTPEAIKEIQCVIGSILYGACTVNITVLMALSSIVIKQTKGTTSTMEKTKQLLDYLATNFDATMIKASNMIMNLHLDTLYLSKANTQSRGCGHFFMGWETKGSDPSKLNGAFFTLCAILSFVVTSTADKLGALFLNCKKSMIFWMTLEELRHLQPKTMVHCDNATTVGITKKYFQKTALMINGNEVFLGMW